MNRAGATRSRRTQLTLCAMLVLLGVLVAMGWLLGIEHLKSVLPGLATMKFNTAIGFVVAGAAIAAAGSSAPQLRRAAAPGGMFLILLGSLTLAEYLGGVSLGIDELIVKDRGVLTGSGIPGRMSPLTAIAWLALGSAILLIASGRRTQIVAAGHFLSVAAGFVAFLAAAGYAFGAQAFALLGVYTAMAIHTAIGLLVAVAATLLTRADEGWLAGFGDTPGARALLTRLLPISLLLPLLLGFLFLLGSAFGLYNAAFGFALLVPATTIALTAVSLLLAKQARTGERALQTSTAALRETQERYRRIFEQTSDLILMANLDQVINDCNPAAAKAVGLTRETAAGRKISDFISPEDFERTTQMLRQKLERGGTTRYDVRVRGNGGERLFWEINSGLTYGEDGRPIGLHVVGRDITERKRAEEHQRLLINELNHRVKNTLAVIQSITHQTLRNGGAEPAVRENLEGRFAALAAAHDLLTRESWTSASLREIVNDAVAPFCSDARCTVDGPELRVNPKTAVSLALGIHELATNAAKYGALSSASGRIAVSWRTEADRLLLEWREADGPAVRPPATRGFGTRLIERGLASELGGIVTLTFKSSGVVCTIDAPIPACS